MSERIDFRVDRDALSFLAGGEMGERIRQLDWSESALRSPSEWPPNLRASLSICLHTRFPIAVYWGPQAILFYNDTWRPILGDKHPWALGRPGREVWSEIWNVVGPVFDRVMATGEGAFFADALLLMNRFGYTEECYFDYTFSPIRGPTGTTEGVFNAVMETTERVLGERRQRTLRDLAVHGTNCRTADDAVSRAAQTLQENLHDVPFALLYLLDHERKEARLAAKSGIPSETPACPERISFEEHRAEGWPIAQAVASAQATVVDHLGQRFSNLPRGAWPDPPHTALILPLVLPRHEKPNAMLVAAVSPRRALDDGYRFFYDRMAAQIAATLGDALAYEQERRRAEALAEIDRAKTLFFTNISHELRTPLTLMLSPLEDILGKPKGKVLPENRELLGVVHRNAVRLLKLVNTLLDFSRIEAGRMEANFEPVDLAAFTADVAGLFQAAVENAGLKLILDCPPLPEPVYVDRDMWEKILLNLLSNALKFTLEGQIEVTLRREESLGRSNQTRAGTPPFSRLSAVLRVRDTGTGIPEDQLEKIFERFHRVPDSRGRTHEGTGIGLALVQELARLHGGAVSVDSQLGKGSTFCVSIPIGKAHLLPERLSPGRERSSSARSALPFTEEVMQWRKDGDPVQGPPHRSSAAPFYPRPGSPARILLVDDNADMRDYVRRLLQHEGYEVMAAPDGEAALAAVGERRPELVLTDVMMPRLDGFGLLRALRENPQTSTLPIILLTARAGEEARGEGLEHGADDYLIKPFSTRELVARVAAQLKLARLRKQAEEAVRQREAELRDFVENAPVGMHWVGPDGLIVWVNQTELARLGYTRDEYIGHHVAEFHADQPAIKEILARLMRGEAVHECEAQLRSKDGSLRHVLINCNARFEDEKFVHTRFFTRDITRRKQAEEALRATEERYRAIVESQTEMVCRFHRNGTLLFVNGAYARACGTNPEKLTGKNFWRFVAEKDRIEVSAMLDRLTPSAPEIRIENRFHTNQGERWMLWINRGLRFDAQGRLEEAQSTGIDITERKLAEQALRQSEERFRALTNATSDVVYRMSPDWLEMRQLQGRAFIADTLEPNARWLDKYIPPDDQHHLMEAIHRAIASKTVFELEHRVIRVDGSLGWTYSRAIPVLDERGQIVEWFGAASDVTQRKLAEEALRRTNEDLTRFNRVAVRREMRMIELKKEINELCQQYGAPERYPLQFERDATGSNANTIGNGSPHRIVRKEAN